MRWACVPAVLMTGLIPVVVAASPIRRGMPFLGDTMAGAVLGGASVAFTSLVLRRSAEALLPSLDGSPGR